MEGLSPLHQIAYSQWSFSSFLVEGVLTLLRKYIQGASRLFKRPVSSLVSGIYPSLELTLRQGILGGFLQQHISIHIVIGANIGLNRDSQQITVSGLPRYRPEGRVRALVVVARLIFDGIEFLTGIFIDGMPSNASSYQKLKLLIEDEASLRLHGLPLVGLVPPGWRRFHQY